ncbi:MAG: hypothetical protein ACPGJV_16005 [Bacteriovoracaceae bacterium]
MSSDVLLLKDFLRVLTPAEINELTTMSDGENLAPLSELLNEKIEEIAWVQTHEGGTTFKKKQTYRIGKSVCKLFRFLGASNTKTLLFDVKEQEGTVHEPEVLEETNDGQGEEKGKHFLDVKDKLSQVQKKLKKVEVLSMYSQNASIDLNQLRKTKDDLGKTVHKGNLINKRQA